MCCIKKITDIRNSINLTIAFLNVQGAAATTFILDKYLDKSVRICSITINLFSFKVQHYNYSFRKNALMLVKN